MVDETEQPTRSIEMHKRNKKPKNKVPPAKRMKGGPGMGKKPKISQKKQKLFRKRAREYNSDDDDDEDEEDELASEIVGDEDDGFEGDEISDDEEGLNERKQVKPFINFAEGSEAFRLAFNSITKRRVDDESLGPVLAASKKLVAAKLSEEVTERKVKGEAKKEKHLIEEKGHVKPANFLDSHEKFLIGVATKGVVKLFNAVNKAQTAQKGLDPSRFRDGKALTKRRKEAFMTELSKSSAQSTEATTKASMSKDEEDGNQPAWAPLRDTFMLTNSKLKDWDKMAVEETDI